MKRSNHLNKSKDDAPVVGRCGGCGKEFPSKYQMKNHVCREQHYG